MGEAMAKDAGKGRIGEGEGACYEAESGALADHFCQYGETFATSVVLYCLSAPWIVPLRGSVSFD
jgi:hypothetical protein